MLFVRVYYVQDFPMFGRDVINSPEPLRRVYEFDFSDLTVIPDALNRTWELGNQVYGPLFTLNPLYANENVTAKVALRSSMIGDVYTVQNPNTSETHYFVVDNVGWLEAKVRFDEQGGLRVVGFIE